MNMKKNHNMLNGAGGFVRGLSVMTALALLSMPAFNVSAAPAPAPTQQAGSPAQAAPFVTILPAAGEMKALPLTELVPGGFKGTVQLTGLKPEQNVDFTVRADEIVTKAVLDLHWEASTSLLPIRTQINVWMNGRLEGSHSLREDEIGKVGRTTIELDARHFKDFNRIVIEFIGQYSETCTDPSNPAIWLAVNDDSVLRVTRQKVRIDNDLTYWPVPFFDLRSNERLRLPVVFAGTPDTTEMTAAAVLASGLAARAAWRGADFPAYLNELPAGSHFAVFCANGAKPDFLKHLSDVTGPAVTMADAPDGRWEKMLVIQGRDSADLLAAARAVAAFDFTAAGSCALGLDAKPMPPARRPYDVPNWVKTDRPTTFAEMVETPDALISRGTDPHPITVNFKLPPDLYLPGAVTVDADLRYNWTKPVGTAPAGMRFTVNDRLVENFPLEDSFLESHKAHLPVVETLSDMLNGTAVPTVVLAERNRFTFDFQYTIENKTGINEMCGKVTRLTHQVEVDPRSKIDFSGLYHFVEMPNLGLYATSGYPFSVTADLGATAVVMPKSPDAGELSVLMNAVGRISVETGWPALRVSVVNDVKEAADRDVLLIGRPGAPLQQGASSNNLLDAAKAGLTAQAETAVSGRAALVAGFESPLTPGRSVVALYAEKGEGTGRLIRALADPYGLAGTTGSTALLTGAGVASAAAGDTYTIGHIPWYRRVWRVMRDRPVLLVFSAFLAALIAGAGCYGALRMLTQARLRVPKKG